jgi:uncharacterized membrane protein
VPKKDFMKFYFLVLMVLCTQSFAQTPGALSPTYQSIRDTIFTAKCLSCHAAGQEADDVPLGDYAKLMADGTIVIPKDLTGSSLISAISANPPKMPPARSALPAVTSAELATIELWIQNGAPEQ